jgi:hypothetical protein
MKFTKPPNKNYKEDIKILKNAIENKELITFSKFCDGEWAVLQNQQIDNKEFQFNPINEKDIKKRKKLLEAFQYKNDRYFIGITCVNVFGIETHRRMKMISGLPEERTTWADIWVNSNYNYFVDEIIPMFSKRTVVLFCNKYGKVENLPFLPYAVFPVENNAWEYNWDYIDSAKTVINKLNLQNEKNLLVLFCCGPFGNILAYELTKDCPSNTYLDIGSTLNPWLQSEGFKRDYYLGNNYFSNMVGAWDQ